MLSGHAFQSGFGNERTTCEKYEMKWKTRTSAFSDTGAGVRKWHPPEREASQGVQFVRRRFIQFRSATESVNRRQRKKSRHDLTHTSNYTGWHSREAPAKEGETVNFWNKWNVSNGKPVSLFPIGQSPHATGRLRRTGGSLAWRCPHSERDKSDGKPR